MKKKIIITISVIVGLLVILMGAFMIRISVMQSRIKAFPVEPVDVTVISDGVYQGQAGDFVVEVHVDVTVTAGKIEKVDITKQEGGPGYEAKDTVSRILKQQSPKVDATTGATGSSLTIQAAVYQALKSAPAEETETE